MNAPIDWLLAGEPFIEYRTRRDLLGQAEAEPDVQGARREMLASPGVQNLVEELSGWPGTVIASHKSAGQPFHKLTFLADLGLTAGDPGMDRVVAAILSHQAPEGPFQLPVSSPEQDGKAAQETWGWALCDAPLIVYALACLGLAGRAEVQAAAGFLAGLVRENGWPCAVSKGLGNFRGPGRKGDPCPYATLVMLKALSQYEDFRDGPACRTGAETLLALWSQSREEHPYMFYMGTDFRKVKAPFVWYDLLHVLDVLTRFAWLKGDPRLAEMLAMLESKADPQGRFTNESIWTAWKAWEFGQKKAPSRWLTLLAWRILGRGRDEDRLAPW